MTSDGERTPIEVVGAVIRQNGRILCAQRGGNGPLAGKWEFPGGKIEAGEDPRVALRREIDEELDCFVDVHDFLDRTVHHYEFATIALSTYWCGLTEGSPRLSEHASVVWLAPEDLLKLDWAPADVPAVRKIVQGGRHGG